jgi:UTP-glucose-1-phosphate uridylyltransferase
MKPTLVLLAAGLGSRFGGLKQMAPMGPHGETLLDYSVFDALRAGFGHVVFIIRRDFAEAFEQTIVRRFEKHIDVALAYQDHTDLPSGYTRPAERTKPWGTGHATWAARHVVQTPFAVINADDFYGQHSYRVLADYLTAPHPAADIEAMAMVGFPMHKTLSEHGKVARGVCTVGPDGHLVRVEEKTDLFPHPSGAINRPTDGPEELFTGQEPVSLNMWGFQPSIFDRLTTSLEKFLEKNHTDLKAEFYLPFAVDEMIQAHTGHCQVLQTTSDWFGVTYADDSARVQASLAQLHAAGDYPEKLWA